MFDIYRINTEKEIESVWILVALGAVGGLATFTFIITTLGVTGLSVSHCPQQKGDGGGL